MATITGSFNSLVSGTLSGTIGTPGPAGATGATGATGAAGSPGAGVAVGGSTGQVLQKLSATNYDTGWLTLPADFITSVTAPLAVGSGVLSVDLSAYSTTAQAAALYYPLSGNPSAFLTASALTPYLTSADAATTYQTLAGMSSYLTTATAASTYYLQTNPSGFITSAALTPYLTSADASTTYALKTNGILKGNFTLDGATSPNSDGTLSIGSNSAGYSYLNLAAGNIQGRTYDGGEKLFTLNGTDGLKLFTAGQGVRFPDTTIQTSAGISAATAAATYAALAGATFTGKVNMAAPTAGSASLNLGVGTAPTTSVAGDIWIATNINFRDSSGTLKVVANTNTINTFTQGQIISNNGNVPALRVTQLGTGNAIQVEDSTTPDATPFVVDQHGKVGVGTAPDATAAIKIDGNGMSFNGLVFNPTATAAHTISAATADLLITINGVNYRIDLRPA